MAAERLPDQIAATWKDVAKKLTAKLEGGLRGGMLLREDSIKAQLFKTSYLNFDAEPDKAYGVLGSCGGKSRPTRSRPRTGFTP